MNLEMSKVVGTVDRGDGYEDLMRFVADRASKLTGSLFTTSAEGLGELFVSKIDADSRQHYRCHACMEFLDSFGGLVQIVDDDGRVIPALWPSLGVPQFFSRAISAVRDRVLHSRITGVFHCSATERGTQVTGPWKHLAAPLVPKHLVFERCSTHYGKLCTTPSEAWAASRHEYENLARAIVEFPHGAVSQALAVLQSGHLHRGETTLGVAKWLDLIHAALDGKKGRDREAVLWRAVAAAPAGWCHVRSTMIGTLLADVVAGKPFDWIKRNFDEKMAGDRYRRTTAEPSEGQIEQAEKLIEATGVARSLRRRFARLAEIPRLWSSATAAFEPPASGGVFAHLRPKEKGVKSIGIPPVTMTWAKFEREVLEHARKIEAFLPNSLTALGALTAAADPGSPGIFRWNNAFTWYLYLNGSLPQHWNLTPGWNEVSAIALTPNLWGDTPHPQNETPGLVMILKGARDTLHQKGGGFFTEDLRAEYHSIRHVLERHVAEARIEGRDEADACGLILQKGPQSWPRLLRVDGLREYKLDRWD